MAVYGLIVNRDTGLPHLNYGLTEEQMPDDLFIPHGCALVKFDDDHKDAALLKALLFVDHENMSVDYKQPVEGGIKYNFDTNTFTFEKINFELNIDALRAVRNNFLSQTDKYMMIPDLPDDIKQELLVYRAALRDATSKVGTEWKTIHDVEWPEFPNKLLPRPLPIDPVE